MSSPFELVDSRDGTREKKLKSTVNNKLHKITRDIRDLVIMLQNSGFDYEIRIDTGNGHHYGVPSLDDLVLLIASSYVNGIWEPSWERQGKPKMVTYSFRTERETYQSIVTLLDMLFSNMPEDKEPKWWQDIYGAFNYNFGTCGKVVDFACKDAKKYEFVTCLVALNLIGYGNKKIADIIDGNDTSAVLRGDITKFGMMTAIPQDNKQVRECVSLESMSDIRCVACGKARKGLDKFIKLNKHPWLNACICNKCIDLAYEVVHKDALMQPTAQDRVT